MIRVALAIPHTPWVPERAKSMAVVRRTLGVSEGETANRLIIPYREFTDRAKNSEWCIALWTWLSETEADWCLQLQDDVILPPNFWPALNAMLSAIPEDWGVIGLAGVHPMATEIRRRGHRWYRTPNNLVGWAYALRHEAMGQFLDARAQYEPGFREMHEDEQIGEWCRRSQIPIFHPVPAICDHDVTVPSSYQNDTHSHRRPAVTWRTFDEKEIEDPAFWMPSGVPQMLLTAHQRTCWFCQQRKSKFQSQASGCEICEMCFLAMAAQSVGVQLNVNPDPPVGGPAQLRRQ